MNITTSKQALYSTRLEKVQVARKNCSVERIFREVTDVYHNFNFFIAQLLLFPTFFILHISTKFFKVKN